MGQITRVSKSERMTKDPCIPLSSSPDLIFTWIVATIFFSFQCRRGTHLKVRIPIRFTNENTQKYMCTIATKVTVRTCGIPHCRTGGLPEYSTYLKLSLTSNYPQVTRWGWNRGVSRKISRLLYSYAILMT